MAIVLKGRKASELCLTFVLSSVIGTYSLLAYVIRLVKHGSTKWLHVKKRNERPKILDSEQYGTHHWMPLKKTRLKLHYVAAGPKDKPLMLFLHGFPEFWYSWRFQLKEFNKDYRTVAVDMRGYGDSDKPNGVRQYTIDKLIDDVDQLIHQLGTSSSSRIQFCPYGHCVPMILDMLEDLFVGKELGAKPGTFTPEDIELYKYTYAEYADFCGPVNYYRAMMRYGAPIIPKTKLQVPTLLIWGTKDGALEKNMADLSGKYVEDFTLRYVEGASHWVQQEEPQQVNKFMQEFLENKKEQ